MQHTGYGEVVHAEMHKLEELLFGKASFKGMDGRELPTRMFRREKEDAKTGLTDYITVKPLKNGQLDVTFDTERMVIMIDMGMDRLALLKQAQEALTHAGFTEVTVIPKLIVDEISNHKYQCPRLHFVAEDSMHTVQQLGKANRSLLFTLADKAYAQDKNLSAAHDVIKLYAHAHSIPMLIKDFDAHINPNPGITAT